MAAQQDCEICGSLLVFRWCDTHGVGVCCTCGAPYTILHYDQETKERIERDPELALKESGKLLAIQYWQEEKRRVFPACFDFMPARGVSYSGATTEECAAFEAWMQKQPVSAA